MELVVRLNFRQQEPTHIMENIVYNELLIRGYNVDVGIVEVCAKNGVFAMTEFKPIKEGKVREIYDNGDSLIMVATFSIILYVTGCVPVSKRAR